MAVINLTIAAVNTTGFLIVTARKTKTPNAIEAQRVFTAEQLETPQNVILPETGEIDSGVYFVDYWTSSDGESLDFLENEFIYDAKKKAPISETRRYRVDGIRDIDPASGQSDLVDPYLDGKKVTKFYGIEGFRPLNPPDDQAPEFDFIAGGGLRLLNGKTFQSLETILVEITYVSTFDDNASNAGMYDSVIKITDTMTLGPQHRNKRLKCETDSNKLQITLEDIAVVPEQKFYYFNTNGGNQSKVRIFPQDGQIVRYQGEDLTEITIGKGEHVRLEKTTDGGTSYWEAIDAHPGIGMVGEIIQQGKKDVKNAIILDGSLFDGQYEPRLLRYIESLPTNFVVFDSNIANVGYTHPAGHEGKFVRHPSNSYFRVPNAQDWYFKSLKSYNAMGTDSNRASDYPGGTAPESVGNHKHLSMVDDDASGSSFPNFPDFTKTMMRRYSKTGAGAESYYMAGEVSTPTISPTSNPIRANGDDIENNTKNIGIIYLVRS